MSKSQNFPISKDFMHFFSKLLTDFVDEMLESVNEKGMCCLVGFSEQYI